MHFLAIAATTVLALINPIAALPGGGGYDGWDKCSTTTCSTPVTSTSHITYLETKTIYVPYTTYTPSEYVKTKPVAKTETATSCVTKSTEVIITKTKTWVETSTYEKVYTTDVLKTVTKNVPVVTKSKSESVCTLTTYTPVVTYAVDVKTICSKPDHEHQGGWGYTTMAKGWGGH